MSLKRFPEEGEVVLATVKEITPYGAYVTLDEYDDLLGFLHISEISTGWVKNIEKHVKERQKIVLKVIRVNERRQEIDLSLRQVTKEEKKRKIMDVKRELKAKGLLNIVKDDLGLNSDERYREIMEEHFKDLYDALENVVRRGPVALTELGIDEEYANKVYEVVKNRIKLPEVEVSGVLEITSPMPNGVEIIKNVIKSAINSCPKDVKVKITYLGSSKFKISLKGETYKIVERNLTNLLKKIEKGIKGKGTYNFVRKKK